MSGPRIHPILECPSQYQIEALACYFNPEDEDESYLDLTLRKEEARVSLRFKRPVNIAIEPGFPHHTGGMVIYDRSKDGLENIGVEVADYESSHGAITFLAKSVGRV